MHVLLELVRMAEHATDFHLQVEVEVGLAVHSAVIAPMASQEPIAK